MSAEHDSQSTAADRTPPSGQPGDEGARANGWVDSGGEAVDPSSRKTHRTATPDRDGPPMRQLSTTHLAVAARERLWDSYRGNDVDGRFVWMRPKGPGGTLDT